jgi:hypothetical protein
MSFDDREHLRPPPRELSAAQLAVRGRVMQRLRDLKQEVKAVLAVGDTVTLVGDAPLGGCRAELLQYVDQWCYMRVQLPDGKTRGQNLGFNRIWASLQAAGRLSHSTLPAKPKKQGPKD